jgi:DNA anti-recombination protein RmuC
MGRIKNQTAVPLLQPIQPETGRLLARSNMTLRADRPMTLAQQDIDYIKTHLGEWLTELSLGKPPAVYEIELRERMVRVEEELRHQRELMREGFEAMDKRFEAMREQMDKRFDAVDKRFEAVDKRFEAVDKRFEAVDKRFEAMDKRFEAMREQMDKRFDQLTRRMDRFMFWSLALTLSTGGLVIGILKLWL